MGDKYDQTSSTHTLNYAYMKRNETIMWTRLKRKYIEGTDSRDNEGYPAINW